MPPKKGGKKKRVDARGYATSSIPSFRTLANAAAPEAETDTPEVTSNGSSNPDSSSLAEDTDNIVISEEEVERAKHLSSELLYIQRCDQNKPFRGRLFPSLPTDITLHFTMPKYLLENVLNYTRTLCSYPSDWQCSAWNYERASRNLHALETAGMPFPLCQTSLIAAAGYDERAAFDYGVGATPSHELPAGWSELCAPSSSGVVDEDRNRAVEDHKLSLQRWKESESSRVDRLLWAENIVCTVKNELDEGNDLHAPMHEQRSESPTTEYFEISARIAELKKASELINSKDKRLLKTKIRILGAEMAKLRPNVDFRRLSDEDGCEKEVDAPVPVVEQDEKLIEETIVDPTLDEEDYIGGLFEETEETGKGVKGARGSSECDVCAFSYVSSAHRSQKSPSQLLDEVVDGAKMYRYIEQGLNKWVAVVEIGPISGAVARRIGKPKGSFVSSCTDIPSRDECSARQLASLRLLFDLTSVINQLDVTKRLNPCTCVIWRNWMAEKKLSIEEDIKMKAALRVSSIEESLRARSSSAHFLTGEESKTSEKNEERFSPQRQKMTVESVGKEILLRKRQGKFPLEDYRSKLPALKEANAIVDIINNNEVTLLAGETGSGKSTQVPQLLARACSNALSIEESSQQILNIIITEPRKVAAISVCQRVKSELGDQNKMESLCGYTVRLDSNVGPRCILEYVTVGVLLRRIQSTGGNCLSTYSHCVVDEVHERSVETDLLLLLLKQYKEKHGSDECTKRIFPRIVLMSATADTSLLGEFWSSCATIGRVAIEGRKYPVDVMYLEEIIECSGFEMLCAPSDDSQSCVESFNFMEYSARTKNVLLQLDPSSVNYDILIHVLKYELRSNRSKGGIIIFMPGLDEINRVINAIEMDEQLNEICDAIPMHSSLSSSELQRAFAETRCGKRKCVVSTNICETGVTIADVDLVIDSGFVKSQVWNEATETSRLHMHLCSRAEALQRRGRAGRVRPGRCIHLFSIQKIASRFEGYPHRLRVSPAPELSRAPLTEAILCLVDQGFEIRVLLESPGRVVSEAKLISAVLTLLDLGALVDTFAETNSQDVLNKIYLPTPLGRALAKLPCDARSGKVLLAANMLGSLRAAAVFIASLDTKSIFNRSLKSSAFFKSQFGNNTESDACVVVNAYSEFLIAKRSGINPSKWCRDHSVSLPSILLLKDIATDLERGVLSVSMGPKYNSSFDITDSKIALPCEHCLRGVGMHSCITGCSKDDLHAAIACGMGSNVAFRVKSPISTDKIFLSQGSKSKMVFRIHRSSFVTDPSEYVVFGSQHIGQTGQVALTNVISVNAMIMVLFCTWTKLFYGEGTVILGRGIGIKMKPESLVALRRLRSAWERLIVGNVHNSMETKKLCDVLKSFLSYNPRSDQHGASS